MIFIVWPLLHLQVSVVISLLPPNLHTMIATCCIQVITFSIILSLPSDRNLFNLFVFGLEWKASGDGQLCQHRDVYPAWGSKASECHHSLWNGFRPWNWYYSHSCFLFGLSFATSIDFISNGKLKFLPFRSYDGHEDDKFCSSEWGLCRVIYFILWWSSSSC